MGVRGHRVGCLCTAVRCGPRLSRLARLLWQALARAVPPGISRKQKRHSPAARYRRTRPGRNGASLFRQHPGFAHRHHRRHGLDKAGRIDARRGAAHFPHRAGDIAGAARHVDGDLVAETGDRHPASAWRRDYAGAAGGVGPAPKPRYTEMRTQDAVRMKNWALAGLVVVFLQIALGGWVSSNYAALACADFPTCKGVWIPVMDFNHAFHFTRAS